MSIGYNFLKINLGHHSAQHSSAPGYWVKLLWNELLTPFLSSIQVPRVLSMLYLRSTLDTILSSIRVPLAIGRFGAPGVSTPPATQIIQSQVKLILVPHAHSIMFALNLNQSLFSPWKSSLYQNEHRSRRKRGRWWWWLCQLRTGKKLHDLACHQMTRHYKLYMMWRFTFGLHWKTLFTKQCY